jgi:hypothetical protein
MPISHEDFMLSPTSIHCVRTVFAPFTSLTQHWIKQIILKMFPQTQMRARLSRQTLNPRKRLSRQTRFCLHETFRGDRVPQRIHPPVLDTVAYSRPEGIGGYAVIPIVSNTPDTQGSMNPMVYSLRLPPPPCFHQKQHCCFDV